jgi:DNA-directed RNA polymerase specialized sigma24 family protein
LLDYPETVVRSLLTYTDAWQPSTSSIYRLAGAGRDRRLADGIRAGLLERLEERSELRRRMHELPDRDRQVLILWYVRHLSAEEIAAELGISRRQCFRRRARAIKALVEPRDDEGRS